MALKRVRKGYIGKAKIRGYPWRLSDAQFEELTRMPCAYCKTERGGQYTHRMKSGDESTHHFMGVDRVDNSLGYEEDNVVPCCKTCNYAKQQMSVDAFLSWAHRVADANPR